MAKRAKYHFKKKRKPRRAAKLNPGLVNQGAVTRVLQRSSCSVALKVPAVPELAGAYTWMLTKMASILGRPMSRDAADEAAAHILVELERAFVFSQRSKVELRFLAPPGAPIQYEAAAEQRSLTDTYEHWLGTDETELFGKQPDARVLAAANELGEPASSPVLDFGAGTGRNALGLARLGYPVDAVEITSRFAQMITAQAAREELEVRTIEADVFRDASSLRRDYRMLFASEVASDLRDESELRKLFELAAAVLAEGGLFIFNAHLCYPGYTPDKAAREFAQHSYSALYTPSEMAEAARGLPFDLVSNDSSAVYERTHLPEEAWPPTHWFENWATGRDVFELERGSCPIELCWLVFRKRQGASVAPKQLRGALDASLLEMQGTDEEVCLDPAALKQGLLRRFARRAVARGQLVLPAVPALHERLALTCSDSFLALGRDYSEEELAEFNRLLGQALDEAFAQSPRSNVVVDFELPMGQELKFELSVDAPSIQDAYADWFESVPQPMFGEHPDARVEALIREAQIAPACPVLDLGAGLGRNALWLAEAGHPVDALEMTPVFAAALENAAQQRSLPVRVVEQSLFDVGDAIGHDYGFVLASGTIADFRSASELRRLFELAAERLATGGLLLISVHVVDPNVLSPALFQWAQQCCAACFTDAKVQGAAGGLGLVRVSTQSAYEFERKNLPADRWPPSPVFEEWSTGRHAVVSSRGQAPLELRWMLYRKAPAGA